MDSIPRPLPLRSRNLFTPVDLESGHKSARSVKKQQSIFQSSRTSRNHNNIHDENEQPLSHSFRWVIDKSAAHKQKEQSVLSQTLTQFKKTLNIQLIANNKIIDKNKRIRGYINSAKDQISAYQSSANGLRERIAKIQDMIEQRKHKQEEVEFDRKILDNMLERMKTDRMFYGLGQKHKEKILRYKTIDNQYNEEKKLQMDNIQAMYGIELINLQDEVQRIQSNRITQVQQAKNAIRKQVRQRKIFEEATDIPTINELHFRKMFLIHTLLQQVLRSRIRRLTQKHKRLDSNFRKIKTATNIQNIQNLVEKYFSEENLHGKLAKQISSLESQMRLTQEKSSQLQAKMKRVQAIALAEQKAYKFKKVIDTQQTHSNENSTIDLIKTWLRDKSKQLSLNTHNVQPQQSFLKICNKLWQLSQNKHKAERYFNNKFFSEGISIKKQPKLLSIARQSHRMAILSNNIRQFNQAELEHFNKMRVNVLKHQKSKTQG